MNTGDLILGLFITGLLVILGGVVLVRLIFRRARTKQRGLPSQERARFTDDTGETEHRADERAGKPTEPKLASSRSQAARAVKGRSQGYAPTLTGQRDALLSCPNCGQFMPAGATFCSHCGMSLVRSESEQQLSLKSPSSSPLEHPQSSQDSSSVESPSTSLSGLASGEGRLRGSPSWTRPDTSPGDVPGQSLHGSLPSPASLVHDTSAAQRVPNQPGNEQPSRGLIVGARSHPGIKRQDRPNEDSLFVMQGMQTHTVPPQPFGVFLVADGLGGHGHGQEASRQAIQTMIDQMLPKVSDGPELQERALKQLLINAVQAANQTIYRQNQEQHTDMGTTITAVVVVGLKAFVANVGDSRTYLYRESEGLRKITKDHSVVAYLVETGIIKPDDIYTHPQRNQIYRNLGAQPLIQVDAFIEPLQPGDRVILCSDGLWEMVRDPAIEQILRSGTDAQHLASALLEAALGGGGADNVSVIVVQVPQSHTP